MTIRRLSTISAILLFSSSGLLFLSSCSSPKVPDTSSDDEPLFLKVPRSQADDDEMHHSLFGKDGPKLVSPSYYPPTQESSVKDDE